MASGPYSFIDIAVLEEVRVRLAAGDALAILSVDLDAVIWANGPGAALFGYRDIETVMGASPGLGIVACRQISAVPGFPRMGRDRPVLVRLASGSSSQAVSFLVSSVTLPDGVPALLLALPGRKPNSAGEEDTAARVVQGFREAGYFAALVDDGGRITAASEGFGDLAVTGDTLLGLVAEVAHENDRLVKRRVSSGNGLIPAGIARLTDDPALHLLIAIDAPAEETVEEAEDEEAPAPSDADLPDRIREDFEANAVGKEEVVTAATSDQDARDPDDWYFNPPEDTPAPPAKPADRVEQPVRAPSPLPPEIASTPVRFVWRTDATGAFSTVSDEFVRAVGPRAADVIGRPFSDVAARFRLDPGGEIAGLLARRDTWSGRTVLWPVAGTDLAAPVDLAALPVYSRDRVFEGFRGFGVARMGDAVVDPSALGLQLSGEAAPSQTPSDADDMVEDEADQPPPVISPDAQRETPEPGEKVIMLSERRPAPADNRLSPGERNAFEEIRARLSKDFSGPAKEDAAQAEEPPQEATPEEAAPFEEVTEDAFDEPHLAALDENAGPEETAQDDNEDDAVEEVAAHEGDTPATEEASEPAEPTAAEKLPVAEHPALPAPPIAAAGFLPSAFSPAGGRLDADPDLMAGLPLPLLIHAGDELYFANREFFDLTGYASLDQIRREGGLDRLFADGGPETAAGPQGRKLVLRTLGGEEFPVDAHLQSIRWQNRTALLLSLRRIEMPAPAPVAVAEPGEENAEGPEWRVAEMRTIIDTATDGVVLIANDGTIRSISRPAEALFGFDSGDVEGKPFASLFAIESQRAARDYLAGLSENGVASVLNDGREVIGREAEGRFIPLFMTIGRLPGNSGYCAVMRDITQWKRAEEELTQARAQAEKASSQKTEFLARVSHEIRTPLNAIIGFSELMTDEKFGPIGSDRYRDYLRDINRSGNHVLDLVNDLLDISKIEAGEQEMNYEAVSLNDTLAESVAMMQPQANRERVIIRSSLASRLPEVVADLRSVRQIALNLLSNAVRYTQAGGQVIVSTSYEPSGDVAMRVRDTGIGMTLGEIDQALKPFKQINALKRGRHEGTGLGLPLTKAMVEANRARFAISSTPGEGTLVEIVFPSTRVLAE